MHGKAQELLADNGRRLLRETQFAPSLNDGWPWTALKDSLKIQKAQMFASLGAMALLRLHFVLPLGGPS